MPKYKPARVTYRHTHLTSREISRLSNKKLYQKYKSSPQLAKKIEIYTLAFGKFLRKAFIAFCIVNILVLGIFGGYSGSALAILLGYNIGVIIAGLIKFGPLFKKLKTELIIEKSLYRQEK